MRISGEKFDMKNGVTITFGGKSAQSVTVPSKTEITAVTPAGTAGESVAVVVTNKKKVEKPATLSQKFTYTDANAADRDLGRSARRHAHLRIRGFA